MRLAPACLFVAFLTFPVVSSADEADRPGEQIVSERLDQAQYGPGVVEHMDVVIARDRARPSGADANPKARNGRHGVWVVPSRRATDYPHSGKHNLTNKWGDTRMGIGFGAQVDVLGAWFAGQGGEGAWTPGVRVIGYRDGRQIQTTDWFEDVGDTPRWFAMNLRGVDRIVIEAMPVYKGAGWYALDDLTYVPKARPTGDASATVVLDFEEQAFGQKLTGSSHAGLSWETGTGSFLMDQGGIPAPQTLPASEEAVTEDPEEGGGQRDNGTPPALIQGFHGVKRGDAGAWSYPPDTCGAVGPNHFVETVNVNFAIYSKATGAQLVNTTLGSFLPGSSGDPRVLFDQHSRRWIVTVPDFNTRLYLAVSTTDDPTGSWFKTNFVVAQGSDVGCWPDYPTLGVNEDGIFAASWMVGCGLTIFAIDKAPLIAPSPSLGTVTAFRGLTVETTQPVHTYGTPTGEYLVARRSSTYIMVRRVTGSMTSPNLSTIGTVAIPTHSLPPDVPSLGSSIPLDSVDARLMNAVYRDGYIWTAHTIAMFGRAACRWYKINPVTLTLADYGTIRDGSLYYFFPSIMVNMAGDAIMGFSGANAAQYAAAYYTGRMFTDPAGEMALPIQLRPGNGSQNLIDSYGRNRFGDYSLCSLDPDNEVTMWTVQEYAYSTDRWGTWIAELDYGDRTPPQPSPLTWETPPTPQSPSAISMTATSALDPDSPPVEYFFFYWGDGSPGGASSGWQLARDYTNVGLDANTVHTYSTRSRDSATPSNLSAYSSPASTATHIEAPTALAAGDITADTIEVSATGPFTNLAVGQSGLFFEWEETATGTPVGDSGWVHTPTVTATSLNSGTLYTFRVTARNQAAITTLPAEADFSTIGGTACDCLGDLNADFIVNAGDIPEFVSMFLGSAPVGPCADFALPTGGTLDSADMQGFVTRLLDGSPCP